MNRTIPLLLAVLPLLAHAQFYEENFDGNTFYPLPYTIDTTQPGNLWQVGPPQKDLLYAPFSPPNVIITDTVTPYPSNNTSSFTAKVAMDQWGFPVFFLRFYHAFDTDSLGDGGYVEISWDHGTTWTNIFDDWLMPLNIENYNTATWQAVQPETLANGQIGFSGRSGYPNESADWWYSSFCWENIGGQIIDSMYVRFTFVSDSVGGQRGGWMIDNIDVQSYIAHPVIEYTRMDDFLKVAPTLIEDRLFIIYDLDDERTHVSLALFDAAGRQVRVLRNGERPRGVEHLLIWRTELPPMSGPLYLKGHIGDREVHERLMLAPQ